LSLAPASSPGQRIRVIIADDSAVVRGLMRRWLEADPRIDLVCLCADGAQAVAEAAARKPDIMLLDVEMPKMDGLAALPELRRAAPDMRIIMASALTAKGANTTIRALSLGATDYIAKPEASGLSGAEAYRKELIEKIVALGVKRAPAVPGRAPRYSLRQPAPRHIGKPAALVIASSTGGPAALHAFLQPIVRRIDAPILIVQHMPATFTSFFAVKLGEQVGKPCREATDGHVLKNGDLLLAPGDFHMRIAKAANGNTIKLDKSEPVNFCRPAADPLFETAAAAWGNKVLAVVLTGMGSDGKNGAGRVVEAGGRVIVQDEASSVVWGMPGAVATAGYAEAVKPLTELSSLTLSMMNGDAA